MKTARIPAPGILFGRYPERRPQEGPSAWARLLSRLGNGTTRSQGYRRFISGVRALQQRLAAESAQTLLARISRLRAELVRDGLVDGLVMEAFAVVTVVCQRELGVALYDTQLIAARIMLNGHLAEMATGEGKTLAAAVTASTAALAGIPVHVVTANDYLVDRDAASLRPLYQALTLTVGAVTQSRSAQERKSAYACDIAYCTAKELVFDYLRDGVAAPRRSALEQRAGELTGAPAPTTLLRGLCMAVVDEADSILIDEARVPFVLSQSVSAGPAAFLGQAWRLSAQFEHGKHFHTDEAARSVTLTAEGRERLRALCSPAAANAIWWLNARHCEDAITLALTARHVLRRGRDFVVENEQVHIVDETTGRKAAGRTWSNGLHQLVEIKEGCAPSAQVATLAQITYQRFFPRYFRLCGMSGTLMESRRELRKIYDVQVVTVPLHRPSRRMLLPTRVFMNAGQQCAGVVARVQLLLRQGRAVLVGTDSVLASEALARALAERGLKHTVLNASQDRHEASIIAAAGAAGAITVATNMAGRGTDIMLTAGSSTAGGLHVICCQQNTSRRIDRQLLGRCARHGDPGSAEYFIALDGPLLHQQWILGIIKLFNENKYLERCVCELSLRIAQRATERRHSRERAALMQHDESLSDWLAFSGPQQ